MTTDPQSPTSVTPRLPSARRGRAAAAPPSPLAVGSMTSRQLVRRARLIETVIDLVQEVGPENLQMREVAERSGVALGTTYRYFTSREHLMAAALAEWQERLNRRVLAAGRPAEGDPRTRVEDYYRRALRAFHRSPQMATLTMQISASTDPAVVETVTRMGATSTAVMEQILSPLRAGTAGDIRLALDSVLTTFVAAMATGRVGLEEATRRMHAVVRLLLPDSAALDRSDEGGPGRTDA